MTHLSFPIPVGPLPAAAITILGAPTPHDSGEARLAIYPVKYDCCGRRATLSHRTIERRSDDATSTCAPCARLAVLALRGHDADWTCYPPGTELPAAGITVRALAAAGTSQKTTWYEVVSACCGHVTLLNHAHINQRLRFQQRLCGLCGKLRGGNVAEERRRTRPPESPPPGRDEQGERPDLAIQAASAWPRPPSLAGQPPWLPGALPAF